MAIKKFMIGMDEALFNEIEEFAKKMHVSRTAAITFLCSLALEERKGMNTLEELVKHLNNQKNEDKLTGN